MTRVYSFKIPFDVYIMLKQKRISISYLVRYGLKNLINYSTYPKIILKYLGKMKGVAVKLDNQYAKLLGEITKKYSITRSEALRTSLMLAIQELDDMIENDEIYKKLGGNINIV